MCSGADVGANLALTERLIAGAVQQGAGVVALPENFALMARTEDDRLRAAERDGDGPVQAFLASLARRHHVWIVAGTVPIRATDEPRVRAACLVYDADGARVARYDKIHLFDVAVDSGETYRESTVIEPGPVSNNLVIAHSPAGRIGLTVCYDLRFPELYRALARQDVAIFSVPAAFTATTGAAHWEVLLRARAIENLAYVVAPGQWGLHANGRRTHGHSAIVGPWGDVLVQRATGDGVVSADIDLDALARLRARFPSPSHRRM